MTDRREFLKALAAAGVCVMAPDNELFAQQGQYKPTAKGGCVDVHHHLSPPGFGGGSGGRGGRGGGGGAGRGGGGGRGGVSPQTATEAMGKIGVRVAILLLTPAGGIHFVN